MACSDGGVNHKFFTFSFTPACAKHDICYEEDPRGENELIHKQKCDNSFYSNLRKICKDTYRKLREIPKLVHCQSAAFYYFQAVSFGGHSGYSERQEFRKKYYKYVDEVRNYSAEKIIESSYYTFWIEERKRCM